MPILTRPPLHIAKSRMPSARAIEIINVSACRKLFSCPPPPLLRPWPKAVINGIFIMYGFIMARRDDIDTVRWRHWPAGRSAIAANAIMNAEWRRRRRRSWLLVRDADRSAARRYGRRDADDGLYSGEDQHAIAAENVSLHHASSSVSHRREEIRTRALSAGGATRRGARRRAVCRWRYECLRRFATAARFAAGVDLRRKSAAARHALATRRCSTAGHRSRASGRLMIISLPHRASPKPSLYRCGARRGASGAPHELVMPMSIFEHGLPSGDGAGVARRWRAVTVISSAAPAGICRQGFGGE